MIKILNSSYQKLAVIKKVTSPWLEEEINGMFTFEFDAVIDGKKSQYIIENNLVEIENNYFPFIYYEKDSREDGTCWIHAECEHISYKLNDEEYDLEYFASTGTPAVILAEILAGTGLTVGMVELTNAVTYSAQEKKSRRMLLVEFANYIGGELVFNKLAVSIVAHRGSVVYKRLQKGKNIKVVSKIYNKRELVNGMPKVSYTCASVEFSGKEFALGDNIELYHSDLDIRGEQLRIVSYRYNPYDRIVSDVEIANRVSYSEDDLYRIETSAVIKEKVYNGVRIGPEFGVRTVRSDLKARNTMNATEGNTIELGDGAGNYTPVFYVHIKEDGTAELRIVGNSYFDGTLSATVIEAIKANIDIVISNTIITQTLYAEKANIAELTVDRLDTSDKVQKFLSSDKSNVDYVQSYDQHVKFITAEYIGDLEGQPQYKQLKDRNDEDVYWTDGTFAGTTKDITAFPVYIYKYNELVKLEITFQNINGVLTPMIIMGAGSGVEGHPDYGKSFLYKGTTGAYWDYLHSITGELRRIKLTDDGVDLSEIATGKVIFTDQTVVEGIVQLFVDTAFPTGAKQKDVLIDTDDWSRYDRLAVNANTSTDVTQAEFVEIIGSAAITLTLSSTSASAGCIKKIKNSSSAIVTLSGTIDGGTTNILYPFEAVELIWNGTDWRVV